MTFTNFSNAARRRFIKGKLIEAAGIVEGGNYTSAIQAVRGKTGQAIKSKSPFVQDLANARYMTDPNDLSHVNRAFTDTLRTAPTDIGEAYTGLYKTSNKIAPTQREANKGFTQGTILASNAASIQPLPPALKSPAVGLAQIHTHPRIDVAAPSTMDINQLGQIRASRMSQGTLDLINNTPLHKLNETLSNKAARRYYTDTPLIAPGADIDSYVAHQVKPGKQDLINYKVGREAFEDESAAYLYDMNKKQQNRFLGTALRQGADSLPELYDMPKKSFEADLGIQGSLQTLGAPIPALNSITPGMVDELTNTYDINNRTPRRTIGQKIREPIPPRNAADLMMGLATEDIPVSYKDIQRVPGLAKNKYNMGKRLRATQNETPGLSTSYLGRYNVPR